LGCRHAAEHYTQRHRDCWNAQRSAKDGRHPFRSHQCNHSTIFLDEIGDLPSEVQVKLLRVLEERQIERLGSPQSLPVDVRIIAATHRNLEQLVAAGAFREDFFYRLNVFPVRVPPLRERADDIPPLVWRLVAEFSNSLGKSITSIAPETMLALQRYAWPGNIRELRNVIERAMILATSELPRDSGAGDSPSAVEYVVVVAQPMSNAIISGGSSNVRTGAFAANMAPPNASA
jgi:transcriptional regulator with PAS, ATPase and Fis domain